MYFQVQFVASVSAEEFTLLSSCFPRSCTFYLVLCINLFLFFLLAQESWVGVLYFQIHFVLLVSRQGKVRLTKWYSPYTQKERSKVYTPQVFPVSNLSASFIAAYALLSLWFLHLETWCWQVIRELSGVILNRGPKLCNFIEWRGYKVVYKR